jgi:DNA polymerase
MPGAPLFVVGQFPGKDEDHIGLPMQGSGGQWVHWATTKIMGVSWDDCFFTNILGCKPPTDTVRRGPLEACTPRIWECLELVKPKLIISMGLVASKFFTGDKNAKMGLLAGTQGVYRGVPVVYVTHPFEPVRQKTENAKAESEAKVIRDFRRARGYAVELGVIDRTLE